MWGWSIEQSWLGPCFSDGFPMIIEPCSILHTINISITHWDISWGWTKQIYMMYCIYYDIILYMGYELTMSPRDKMHIVVIRMKTITDHSLPGFRFGHNLCVITWQLCIYIYWYIYIHIICDYIYVCMQHNFWQTTIYHGTWSDMMVCITFASDRTDSCRYIKWCSVQSRNLPTRAT